MAGALAPQPPDPYEDAAPQGALSSGSDYQDEGYPADYEQEPTGDSYYKDTGRQILQGALSQIAGQGKARSEAAAGQLAAIERAKANLRLLGSQAPNPFREMMAGLGQNTRTGRFGESVGNAVTGYQSGLTARRTWDTNMTNAQNDLDIAGAKIPWDLANAQEQETDRRLRLGEQFMNRADTEENRRQAIRERIANDRAIREQARINEENRAAAAEAEHQRRVERDEDLRRQAEDAKLFSTWVGNDKDTGLPILMNKLGETRLGERPIVPKPSGAGGSGQTALQKNIDFLKSRGIAKDDTDAFQKLKTAATNPEAHQRLVLEYVKELQKDLPIGSAPPMTSLVQQAEKAIKDAEAAAAAKPLLRNSPFPGGPVPGTKPAPIINPVNPAPAAAPAAAPAPAAANAAPAVPAGGGATAALPPQVRSTLKPGVGTIVRSPTGEVQTWTLQNGQPVRVK